MALGSEAKRDFATRLSQRTLSYLDELVRRGRFPSRTAAIEAAIARLYAAERETVDAERVRKRKALDEACGMFHLGLGSERIRELEADRLEYEAERARGKG